MAKEAEKFLQAEQSAQELLVALTSLKQEAVSYKTSTLELEATRQKLVELINSIQAIAKNMNEVINSINRIGGPEILRSIDSVSKIVKSESENTNNKFQRMKSMFVLAILLAIITLGGVIILLLK